MDSDAPLSAYLKKATEEYSLCPNRVWAVAGSLLPMLIPTNNPNRPCNHGDELPNHEMCTFEFCEYSQRDFTAINQRHECRDKKCERLQGLFSRQVLEQAATADESTVWRLDGHSTISRLQPYMAVSHVWSDGTGAGKWLDGEVNECLYNFFRRIAVQFQCDRIWWDTLCIPQEKAARTKAVKKIQSNYENARITLVHDCFLRNWTWDPETACFAILMSPWFSRGWTALELQRSRKVKVVFKGSCGLVIKDLDEEILVEEGDGPRREASDKIRSLRKEITTLNDLLTVIKPRYTSWPKDVSIISGLLTDVELSSDAQKEIWQQDVYKRIVKKIGKVSFDHLFHNSATMSKVGWCPPSIYDMPVADNNAKALLKVTPELHLDGTLRRIPLDAVHDDRYNWRGVHPLIREHLKLYLRKEKGACFLLIEPLSESNPKGVERAILGKERESQIDGKPCYEFVGAVHFQPGLEIGDLVKRGDLDPTLVPLILLGDANGSMAETGEQAQPQSHS